MKALLLLTLLGSATLLTGCREVIVTDRHRPAVVRVDDRRGYHGRSDYRRSNYRSDSYRRGDSRYYNNSPGYRSGYRTTPRASGRVIVY